MPPPVLSTKLCDTQYFLAVYTISNNFLLLRKHPVSTHNDIELSSCNGKAVINIHIQPPTLKNFSKKCTTQIIYNQDFVPLLIGFPFEGECLSYIQKCDLRIYNMQKGYLSSTLHIIYQNISQTTIKNG